MLMTALQILATPAPPRPVSPVIRMSSPSVTLWSGRCPGGDLASLCREGATFVVPWGSHTDHASQGLAALVTSCG